MRILVDVTHPAFVHFFRHPIRLWRQRGHQVLITSRRKDITVELLDRLQMPHRQLGRSGRGLLGLLFELPLRTARLSRQVRAFRPDVLTAAAGVWAAQAGWLHRIPSVIFYDTDNDRLSNLITYPFSTLVVTPRCYSGWVPARKHLTYSGYHALAYTHPARFTADRRVPQSIGLDPAEPFIVMRLVSWGAVHDVSHRGFRDVEAAVRKLERYGRVVISSERPLPESLSPYRLTAPPEEIHHLLAHARLFIGESATMASESATLGTPAILVSTSTRCYTDDQERRYGLTFTFRDPENGQRAALTKAAELLERPHEHWAERRRQLLDDAVDVGGYAADLVERCGRLGRRARRPGPTSVPSPVNRRADRARGPAPLPPGVVAQRRLDS